MKLSAIYADMIFKALTFISERNRRLAGGRGRPPKNILLMAKILAIKLFGGCPLNSFAALAPESTLRYWRDLLVKSGFSQRFFNKTRDYALAFSLYDFKKINFDGSNIKSPYGGDLTGSNWKEKGRIGTKIALLTDRNGMPLSFSLHSARSHDIHSIIPTIEAFPHQKRLKNAILQADKAFDSEALREELRKRNIEPDIPYRKSTNSKKSKKRKNDRWIIEQTFGKMKQTEATRIRRERKLVNWSAVAQVALGIILLRVILRHSNFSSKKWLDFLAFCHWLFFAKAINMKK